MFIAKTDLRYAAYCPLPEFFTSFVEYTSLSEEMCSLLSESLYLENRLALKGIDISLMDEAFLGDG